VDVRRGLRVSSRVHAPEINKVTQNESSKASGWSQSKVFAVALGAGALGWGLANLNGDGDSIWSRSSAPHYANVSEMEKADCPPEVLLCTCTNCENRLFDELRKKSE
jgi:D-lactate dehydrogenase (cytochrome)